jgi:uncharacterized protein YjbJ (UPF0337 family)
MLLVRRAASPRNGDAEQATDGKGQKIMASGPSEAKTGVVEEVKGRAKEAAGAVTNNDKLASEGCAQQDRAQAARDAAKSEAEAEGHRAEEKAAEARERAVQQGGS